MLTNNVNTYPIIAKNDLNFLEKLGQGAQGTVYKAFWESKQQTVAVKHVFEFDPELSVLQSIRHKNIVTFLGAVDEEHFKAIVLEYAEHGSLHQYLTESDIGFEQLLIWARHIAMGLNYLHNEAPNRIIHRDLKSRNVVIAAGNTAKICDFGSSKAMEKSTRFSKLHGTVPWMAPEVIRNSKVSPKCDTYSFGILLWELITGKTPFQDEEEHALIFAVCQHKRRPPIPDTCPEKFAQLVRDCWDDDPEKRPDIQKILYRLNGMLSDLELTDEVNSFLDDKATWCKKLEENIKEIQQQYKDLQEDYQRQINDIKDLERWKMRPRPKLDEGPVSSWSELEVARWLNYELNDPSYDQYCSSFLDNHITGSRLLQLEMEDLQKLGVTSLGHRKDIMKAVFLLKQKLEDITNYPPLVLPTSKHDKTSPTKQGTKFTLTVTYGNNYHLSKWNLFLHLEGDEIARKSVKCVEFRFSKSDIIKLKHSPYVMDYYRNDFPKDDVKCTVSFRGNIIKPKSWVKEFAISQKIGGLCEESQVDVYLNEEQSPSAVESLASSYSSFSSFNMIDSWQTSNTSKLMGAWAKGPPSNFKSFQAGRRDSSPFGQNSFPNSPHVSPESLRKPQNPGLNRSRTSPAKMSGKPSRTRESTWSPFSLGTPRSPNITPTHDPRNPRFTSFKDHNSSIDFSEDPFSLYSDDTADLNGKFRSVETTLDADENNHSLLLDAIHQIRDNSSQNKESENISISMSSTITSKSGNSVNEMTSYLDDLKFFTPTCEPTTPIVTTNGKSGVNNAIENIKNAGIPSFADILKSKSSKSETSPPQDDKQSRVSLKLSLTPPKRGKSRSRTSSESSDKRVRKGGSFHGRGSRNSDSSRGGKFNKRNRN